MRDRIDPRAELARAPVFGKLAARERDRLAQSAAVTRRRKGEVLLRAGETPDRLLVLVRGWAKLVRRDRDGADRTLWALSSPGLPGLASLLLGLPAPGDYVALEDAALLEIPAEDFEELLGRSPAAGRGIAACLAALLMETASAGRSLHTGRVEARIATLLVGYADRIGVREADGLALYVPLTRQDMADMLGTTVGTVIRTMRAWKEAGVLDYRRGRIAVADLGALRRAAAAPAGPPQRA